MSHRASRRPQTTLIDAPERDPYSPSGRPRVNLLPLPERRELNVPLRWYDWLAIALMTAAAIALALRLT